MNRNLHSVLLLVVVAAASRVAHSQSPVCDQAASHFQARRWAEAAQAYAECEKLSPPGDDVRLFRAKALVNIGDFAGGAAELDAYIATKPQLIVAVEKRNIWRPQSLVQDFLS